MIETKPLALPGVLLITPPRHRDPRGWFSETWSRAAFAAAGVSAEFVQDNQAFSARRGAVRGLHLQVAPSPQAKLVRVLRGAIFDVAVDVRAGSPTFGKWVSATLTAQGGEQLFVPRGFAHGYCTTEDATEVFYKVDGPYDPAAERGVAWDDPALGVDWPVAAGEALLSDKDRALPPLSGLEPIRL